MISKEQIAEAAEKYAKQENSAWTNDYNGFVAGAMFVQQLLQQIEVSGWQEFEKMPLNVGDTVLVKSKKTGRLQIWEIKDEDFGEEYLKAYCWIYPPI